MYIANAFSRAYLSDTSPEEETFDSQVMSLETTAVSPPRYDELVDETAKRDTKQSVTHHHSRKLAK